jgi:trans-2,3-dihydro-3-hydroxyanthranilate isomerase
MGRRSVIELDVRKTHGAVRDVHVTGRCVPVMRGTIEV